MNGFDNHAMASPGRQIAALAEVLGVLVVGAVGAGLVVGLLPAGDEDNPFTALQAAITARDQVLKYGLIMALAMVVGWWHRRRSPRAYGLTLGQVSLGRQLGIGVLVAAAGLLPAHLLLLLHQLLPLGPGTEMWDRIAAADWDLGFWLYMAAGSFLVVPVVEELFARGYMQMRLVEDLGAGTGIAVGALIFALVHGQYLQPSVLTLGMLGCIIWGSLLIGYVYYRTGSLLPGMVAHALGNVPAGETGRWIVAGLMILAILAYYRTIGTHLRQLAGLIAKSADRRFLVLTLGTVVLVVGGMTAGRLVLVAIGVAALILALILEARERAGARRPEPSGI